MLRNKHTSSFNWPTTLWKNATWKTEEEEMKGGMKHVFSRASSQYVSRLSLLSSGDPWCVVSTAIKQWSLFRSPHVKSDRNAHEIWRPFSARATELDVLVLLYICWTFHSYTPNSHCDQVSTQNPSFINAQVDLTYSAVRGRVYNHEALT